MANLHNLFIRIKIIYLLKRDIKFTINCKSISSSLLLFLYISIELQYNAILDLYIDLTIYIFLVMNYLIHIGIYKLLSI